MADDLVARLRATGGSQFSREMRRGASDVRALGTAGSAAAAGLRSIGSAGRSAGISLRQLAGAAAGYKVAQGFKAAAMAGVEFNKVQDAQRVGFTALLGGASEASQMMRQVQQLALDSPLLDVQSAGDAVRSLLAYGVAQRDVIKDAKRLGDMSAASGKDVHEGMTLGARALGQIQSRGRLSMEELNQLSDSVGLSQSAIRKELGMTQKEFAATFTPGNAISATKALPAIRRAMERQSRGASDMLSKTTAGQFQIARERFAMTIGTAMRPAFDETGRAVGRLSDELFEIFQRKDLSLDDKLTLSQGAIKRNLAPLGMQLQRFWRENHLGDRLSDAIEAGTPKILDTAGKMGVRAAGTFVHAWWNAGPWGKLITAAFLAKRLGAFGAAGSLAARLFTQGFGKGKGGAAGALLGRGSTPANPLFVAVVNGGVPGAPGGGGKGGRRIPPILPGLGRGALRVGAGATVAALIAEGIRHYKGPKRSLRDAQEHTRPNRDPMPRRTPTSIRLPGSNRAIDTTDAERLRGYPDSGSRLHARKSSVPAPPRGGLLGTVILKIDSHEVERILVRNGHNSNSRR